MVKRLRLAGLMLLILALVTVGCARGQAPPPPIKIGVIGPMKFIHGEHHWYGATLAAEEINEAGGILVGEIRRPIELVKVDSNEIVSVSDAKAAMEKAITVEKVDFMVGGFETIAALAMQDVAMDHEKIWLGCGVAVSEMCRRVGRDYERYKYWFRAGPVNSFNIGNVNICILEMVSNILREELGIEKPRVAMIAEDAPWVDQFALLEFCQEYIPTLDMEIVGVWRPSPTATDLTPELIAIKDKEAHIIFFNAFGPVGVTFARQWSELKIPAVSVGLHLEAMKSGFPEATEGKADYATYWHSIARVEITAKTVPFYDKFVQRFGEHPFITACTYDGIYLLKEVIEAAGTLDPEPIITELEKTDYLGAFGKIKFTPRGFLQVGDEIPHDLMWGPEYATTVAIQWQDGEPKCVWPWEWDGRTYQGTVKYELPPWVREYWQAKGED